MDLLTSCRDRDESVAAYVNALRCNLNPYPTRNQALLAIEIVHAGDFLEMFSSEDKEECDFDDSMSMAQMRASMRRSFGKHRMCDLIECVPL